MVSRSVRFNIIRAIREVLGLDCLLEVEKRKQLPMKGCVDDTAFADLPARMLCVGLTFDFVIVILRQCNV